MLNDWSLAAAATENKSKANVGENNTGQVVINEQNRDSHGPRVIYKRTTQAANGLVHGSFVIKKASCQEQFKILLIFSPKSASAVIPNHKNGIEERIKPEATAQPMNENCPVVNTYRFSKIFKSCKTSRAPNVSKKSI